MEMMLAAHEIPALYLHKQRDIAARTELGVANKLLSFKVFFVQDQDGKYCHQFLS